MAALKNHKHEWFAQALAKGKSQAEAYAEAGYAPSEPNASRLTRNDKVQARVSEIQAKSVIRTEDTVSSLIQEAGEIQAAAMQEKQLSAATAALTVKAKLAGLWVDKAESTNRNIEIPANRMTDDQLEAIASGRGDGTSQAPQSPNQLN
jgi:phage terminase small subunit